MTEHDNRKGSDEETAFLSSEDAREVFDGIPRLLAESDRGAVLICSCYVDETLDRMFRSVAPPRLGKKALKGLLDHGPLSTLGAKSQVAVLCGLIPFELGESIAHLRKLRNEVAHSQASFRLRDHWSLMRKIYDLGPGVPFGINRIALELLLKWAIERMAEIENPFGEEGEKHFNTPAEVVDYLDKHKDILKPLDEKTPRLELAIGTGMICDLIVIESRRRAADRGKPSATDEGRTQSGV